jgi:hypothetical protein
VALVAGSAGYVAGYVVAVACVAGAVVLLMCQVFRLAVYRYATGEGGTGPFAAADLEAAFKPSPVRRFLRRR